MRGRFLLPLAGLLVWPAVAPAQSQLGEAQDPSSSGSQSAPVVIAPPPPIVSAPLSAPMPQLVQPQPPGLVETPVPPVNQDSGAPPADNAATPAPNAPAATQVPANPAAPQVSAAPPAPADTDTAGSTPPPVPNDWVRQTTAQIGILDKVDGGASTISIPVGGKATQGDLSISVGACVSRPPTEVPDDAIFVTVQSTDAPGGAPLFSGWMVRSIPAATVVGDASETLRVVSCS